MASLIPNDYLLDLNRSLMVPTEMDLPAPWNLPSRLFTFPIEVSGAGPDGKRRYGLRHPRLADHPFVALVEAELGINLEPFSADDPSGRRQGEWWHAVDLVSAGRWRDLLETKVFTTDHDIAAAAAFGLDYSAVTGRRKRGHIAVADARKLLLAIGCGEPADRLATFRSLSAPSPCSAETGHVRWPVNDGLGASAADGAWARIFGLDSTWLKHDGAGFLQWTETGRAIRASGSAITFTDARGQGAFAF